MSERCSERKREANRLNAQKSTGPKTLEGKAVASRNATTHGLTASTSPVALDESQEEFDAFADALRADLRPRGAVQVVLVERVVHLSWKLRRLPAVEAEAITRLEPRVHTDEQGPHGERIPRTATQTIACDAAGYGVLARLQTYESRIERSLHACLRELANLRKLQADDPAWQNEATGPEDRPPSPCNQDFGELSRAGEGGGEGPAELTNGAVAQNEATASVPNDVKAGGRNEATASVPSDANAIVQNEATETTEAPLRNEATEGADGVEGSPIEVADETEVARGPEDPRRGKAVLRVAPDRPGAALTLSPLASENAPAVNR